MKLYNDTYNQIRHRTDRISINNYLKRTLAHLRDTPLPKLMNGEVRVQLVQGEAAI